MQQNLYGYLRMLEMQKKAYDSKTPIQGTFEITPRCNFNCRMCYVHLPVDQIVQYGKELTAKQWLVLGKQAVDMGVLSLCITGGDPLCHPEFKEIWEGLSQMGFQITLQTNASLINDEILDLLDLYPPEMVKITLYGSNDLFYEEVCRIKEGFTKTNAGIQALKSRGHRIQLVTTFIQQNRDDAQNIQEYAKVNQLPWYFSASCYPSLRGAQSEALQCAIHIWDEKNIEQTSKLWNKMKPMVNDIPAKLCSGYRTSFNISWNGYMRFCLLVNEPDISVLNQPLQNCWQQMQDYLEKLRWPEECYDCDYKYKCKRCLAHLACFSGGLNKINKEYCNKIKEMIDMQKEEYL